MTKPCPTCGVETDCEHREKIVEMSSVREALSGCYDDGVKAGLRRAVEIVKELNKDIFNEVYHCVEAIEKEINKGE